MKSYQKFVFPYYLWVAFFVMIPTLMVLYYAFTMEGSFSLVPFSKVYAPATVRIILRSLKIALITTLLCFFLGYPMAYFIARMDLRYQGVAMALIIIPMWMNFLLRTYAWVTLLSRNGLLNTILLSMGLSPQDLLYTEAAVILGMVYNFLPFMILPIYTVLDKMDRSLNEAASDLGARPFQSFFYVTLPLSKPGIISGVTMVFVPVISTFEITSLLGGGKTSLVGNVISQQFVVTGNWNYGSALAVVLMIFLVISLFIDSDSKAKEKGKSKRAEKKRGRA